MTKATKRQRKRARAKRHQKGALARNRQRGYSSSDLVRLFGALKASDGSAIVMNTKEIVKVRELAKSKDRSSFHTTATQRRLHEHVASRPGPKPTVVHLDEVNLTPTEQEWDDLRALAKRRKRSVAKIAAKEGWEPTGDDPKTREGWKKVIA